MSRVLSLLVCCFVLLAGTNEALGQYFSFGKNKVQYEKKEWHYIQSTHFDVYYYEGGRYLADFTARAAEDAYEQISALFQHQIKDRVAIMVYQGHNDFAVTNVADLPVYAEGIGGVTELFKNRVALPFTGDYQDYRRVVHHELIHAVINDMFYGGSLQSIVRNNIQLRIPLWFNEGLAEYAALGWDTKSDMYVREAVLEDNLAPIPYLGGYFAYRGGQSVWDYIAEQYGTEKIAEILQRLRVTRSVDQAFKETMGLDVEELSERWHESLEEIHFPEKTARTQLGEIGKALITPEKHGGVYNTSPAISPQGDKVAYITTKNGLFDVVLARASDGRTIRTLVEGQESLEFESLRILTPGITWSPDGEQIAIAVKSGRSDAVALVDVRTGDARRYRVPEIDQVISLDWSPDGERIAFEGLRDAQSDIYVLDLETEQVQNYTDDVFSDREPAWSPDGRFLVFHSDRGAYTRLGVHQPATFPMVEHDYGQYDLYRLYPGARRTERLTFDEEWNERSAEFGADPSQFVYISDRNGIPNLYLRDLQLGTDQPLTDLSVGVMQLSLSADGQKAAVLSLYEGTPSVFLLRTPMQQEVDAPLRPNVWAQRAAVQHGQDAPAVALASSALQRRNPFVRDAVDRVPYERFPFRGFEMLARRGTLFAEGEAGRADDEEEMSDPFALASRDTTTHSSSGSSDTTAYGGVRVDFRNYVFSEAFDEASRQQREERGLAEYERPFEVSNNRNESGAFIPRDYKLAFSRDLVYGATQFDIYGVQGVTQMLFSDMLGNHQIGVASNLLLDLRTSDYFLSYSYLPHRTDYNFFGYHTAQVLSDPTIQNGLLIERYFRFRQYGIGGSARYPFDKFHRVDLGLSLLGVSQADVLDPRREPTERILLQPSVTLTRDVTVPGMMYPRSGHRLAARLSGSPGNLVAGRQVRFGTVLGDARYYLTPFRLPYTFAFRFSGGASFGPDAQTFYTAGVQNWLNRTFDETRGFPVDDVTDFLFATPVSPLRGYQINSTNGSRFSLLNAEFRFPLIAALLPGPVPLIPFYNIQGTAFVDIGAVWGGPGDDGGFDLYQDDSDRFDDLLVGTGFGLRTILLGLPVRMDLAWPYTGDGFGDRRLYFSIGLDF